MGSFRLAARRFALSALGLAGACALLVGTPAAAFADAGASATPTVTVAAPVEFSNAELVTLTHEAGLYATIAVVDGHRLTFYADVAGSYSVARTGDDVWSRTDALASSSLLSFISSRNSDVNVLCPSFSPLTGKIETDNKFNPYTQTSGKTVGAGTSEAPVVALSDFVSVGSYPAGSLEMSVSTADALLGFSNGGARALAYAASGSGATDFDPTYLLVEARDQDTGSLLASVSFEPGDESRPAASGEGGAQAFNLIVNPSYTSLYGRIYFHSAYKDDHKLAKSIATQVEAAEAADDYVVLANLDTMCAYTSGPKTYTLDIATLSSGEIEAGDEVVLKYLVAAGDEDAYGKGSVNEAFEAALESTEEKLTVDADGYVTFDLYGGGVYSLGSAAAVAAATINTDPSAAGDDPAEEPETGGSDDPAVTTEDAEDTTVSTTVSPTALTATASGVTTSSSTSSSKTSSSSAAATTSAANGSKESVSLAANGLSRDEIEDAIAEEIAESSSSTALAVALTAILAAAAAGAGYALYRMRKREAERAEELAAQDPRRAGASEDDEAGAAQAAPAAAASGAAGAAGARAASPNRASAPASRISPSDPAPWERVAEKRRPSAETLVRAKAGSFASGASVPDETSMASALADMARGGAAYGTR